jgi:uncharacterized damage-inducible protein DinB
MRKQFAILFCALAPLAAAGDGAMTAAERSYLLEQLEATQKTVLSTLQGVSDAQWRFKPAPNVWSVQECAEHIILAEEYLLSTTQKILQTPASSRLDSANADADRKFFDMIQDRSHKATAPEPIVPAGKFASPADAAKEFTARRAKTIAYVKSTNYELRVHSVPGPAGQMDAYQFLLLLASHSARHSAQIREVQANPGYPKASAL